jgi:hypothetical protein
MRLTFTCFALSCLFAVTTFGAAPPAKVPAEWLKLIDQLGDEDEAACQRAEKKLAALGEDALPALRRASKTHADADVRLRGVVLASEIEKVTYSEVRCFDGCNANSTVTFALLLTSCSRLLARRSRHSRGQAGDTVGTSGELLGQKGISSARGNGVRRGRIPK